MYVYTYMYIYTCIYCIHALGAYTPIGSLLGSLFLVGFPRTPAQLHTSILVLLVLVLCLGVARPV